MELEDLKTTWRSVKPYIGNMSDSVKASPISDNRKDAWTRLRNRSRLNYSITAVCLVMVGTSRLWAPVKFPVWWLVAFSLIVLAALICEVHIFFAIKNINPWEDSNREILSAVIRIKKQYRYIEVITSIIMLPLLIQISLLPMFIGTWRMIFVWCMITICYTLEIIWYKSNMRQFNRLSNWDKD